jgi:hypothetical protein
MPFLNASTKPWASKIIEDSTLALYTLLLVERCSGLLSLIASLITLTITSC